MKVMNSLYVAWRTAMRKVWRIPWTTHNDFLPMLADVMPPNLMLEKRAITFSHQLLNSNNRTVNMITGMALHGSHSVLGQNMKYLIYKYDLNVNSVYKFWNTYCQVNPDLIRHCEQIKEICKMRDSYHEYIMTRPEAKSLMDVLSIE